MSLRMIYIFISVLALLTCGGNAYEFQTTEVSVSIRYHVATTTMNLQLTNNENITKLAKLYLLPPVEAFFTDLSMTIGNETLYGSLGKKKKLQKEMNWEWVYEFPAALLETCEKWLEYDDHVYKLQVVVEAHTTANLKLTYQQLLKKVNGQYQYEVSVVGNKPSQMLDININICETRNIEIKSVSPQNATVTFLRREKNSFAMQFNNKTEQITRNKVAKLILNYKLADDEIPEVILGQGYFAYFGPELPYHPRKIMFALQEDYDYRKTNDIEIDEAMESILDSLTAKDHIGILKFGKHIKKWRKGKLSKVSAETIRSAKKFLFKNHGLYEGDYPKAIELGIKLLKESKKKQPINHNYDFLVVFSDGSTSQRRSRMMWSDFGIHTLRYGSSYDDDGLVHLAGGNHGKYRMIFGEFDVTSQFKQYVKIMDESEGGGSSLEIHYPAGVWDVSPVRTPHGGIITRTGKYNTSSNADQQKLLILEAQMPNSTNVTFQSVMAPKEFDTYDELSPTCDADFENLDEHPAKTIYRLAKLQQALYYVKKAHYAELRRKNKKIASALAFELEIVSPYSSLFLSSEDR